MRDTTPALKPEFIAKAKGELSTPLIIDVSIGDTPDLNLHMSLRALKICRHHVDVLIPLRAALDSGLLELIVAKRRDVAYRARLTDLWDVGVGSYLVYGTVELL